MNNHGVSRAIKSNHALLLNRLTEMQMVAKYEPDKEELAWAVKVILELESFCCDRDAHIAELEKDIKVAKGQYQGACDIIKELERRRAFAEALIAGNNVLLSENETLKHKLAGQQARFRFLAEAMIGTTCPPAKSGEEELNTLLAKAKEEGRREAVLDLYAKSRTPRERMLLEDLMIAAAPKPQGE